METLIETNEYQTPITKELKDSLDSDVYADLVEFIGSVEFVKNLISPDRKRVEDLEKDKRGRAIIDVTRPHILENIEYFIQSRRHFEKHGTYSTAVFSRDPRSEYMKFWTEEERRSIHGMVRPDGEWIPGYLYFYWNYGRIDLTVPDPNGTLAPDGTIRSDRIEMFPDIWEIDYFYYHYIEQGEERGKYGSLLKCRGMGASFKSANMGIRNFFILRKSKSYMFSYHSNYLFEDGIMNKVMVGENFMQSNTAFRKRKLKTTIEHLKAGFKDKANNNAENGYLSEIIPVITKDPNSARGKRGKLVIHEEAGSHKHILDSWRITDKSLNDKGNVFGYQLAQGTGGDDQSDFRGLVNLFYRPKGYDIHAIRNVFDKKSSNTLSGFFMGEYMNRPRSYNENGTTDVVKNLITIFKKRKTEAIELDSPDEIAKKKAEGAITPQEAITNMGQSPFPKELIKERVAEITSNWEEIHNKINLVKFQRRGDNVQILKSSEYIHITDFPYLGKQASKAALAIAEPPETHGNGSIPDFRYIIGVDTLDNDNTEGSLFAFQVMDLWKDEIVAWYIGRDIITEHDYDLVLCTAIHYNATVNYESNLKGLYGHFKNCHALRYLCDTPKIVADKGLGKINTIGNSSKGTRANKGINAWGRRLQADWQRSPHSYYEGKVGCDTVVDVEWLRECNLWEPMGNYDKVSAGNMLFIYREDLLNLTESTKFDKIEKAEYEGDPFFDSEWVPQIGAMGIDGLTENEFNF